MITGLIQAKKWKKIGALVLAGAVAATGAVCIALRTLPLSAEELDSTALIAAGFLLPDGAMQQVLNQNEPDETPASADAPSKPEPTRSEADSSPAEPSSKAEKKPAKKVWSGKASPIYEMTMQNMGVQHGDIFVRNDNDYTSIDIKETLEKTPDLSIKKDGTPQVLLYHTHTSESYLTEESDAYYSDMATRSSNPDESVIAVGEAIKKQLEAAGIGVIHDTTVHDERYSGSYSRSAETIDRNLKEHPTIQVTIDIHRDALVTEEGAHYKPTTEIHGKKAAQIMIISGCDDDGTLGFPDWEYNLRLAMRLQQACVEIDPGFPRPLYFCPRNYNENKTRNSLLVEFGTEVSTVDEAVYSGELFGSALVSVLSEFAG